MFVSLHHQKIKNNPERISDLKPFINQLIRWKPVSCTIKKVSEHLKKTTKLLPYKFSFLIENE